MKTGIPFLSFVMLILSNLLTYAQTLPEYNMSNATVYDCNGILKDSEALVGGTTYGHNENFTFVIATGGKITMTFDPTFCTESGIDTLRFFDGPNISSPKIGSTYSGTVAPPTIVANSGYLTVHFVSDGSVAYCGWEAEWRTTHVPPVPPVMTINPIPACNATTIPVRFSKKIACDSIVPNDFTITGPIPLTVTSVTSTGCTSPGDSTILLNLGLNQPIDVNCTYRIDMNIGIADNCDSIWHFTLTDSFLLKTCPFTVAIQSRLDTICDGTCTQIEAVISGDPGNCLSYNYTWSHGLPNSAGPHLVCPTSTTVYTVAVQQVGGGNIVNASKTITFIDPMILSPDTITLCQSDSPIVLNKTPLGGTFIGNGITNQTAGIFNPSIAGGGNHLIKYNMTTECYDSMLVIVKPIDAGPNEAACPGVPPFMVTGFSPPGGTWSGDSITPAGLFNPVNSGTFNITYTLNGCSASKKVFVDSVNLITMLDTVCESDPEINIIITPPGGIWNGPGITDSLVGNFNPGTAGPGNKTLIYKLNGCNFSIDVFVKEIEAGNNQIRCPLGPPFIITPSPRPAGGTWSGLGILNGSTGLYDPGLPFGGSNGNDTLTYTASNGCSDIKVIYLRRTRIIYDTLFFCVTDNALLLNYANVRRTPGGGVWTGPAITKSGANYYFHPSQAGVGTHTLNYYRDNCSDSIKMIVHPVDINFPDTTVCSTHPKFSIGSFPPGGKWTGSGVDPNTGEYDPSQAAFGSNYIQYISPQNCVTDTVIVTVYPFVPAEISGIDSILCYKDSGFSITLAPLNGILTGPGLDANNNFNPVVAGEGQHQLYYTFGKGWCETSDDFLITVLPKIKTTVNVTDVEICPGESSTITISPSGGLTNAKYNHSWSHGLFPQSSNPVVPGTTTTYYITTSDGCSEDVTDTVTITVAENFTVGFRTNDKLCFGDEGGYIVAFVNGSGNYSYAWQGPNNLQGDSINGKAGDIYTVNVTDNETGCMSDTIVKIPSYGNVKASFLVNPNSDCIPSDRKNVIFIDISNNAVTGLWEFGTGDTAEYMPGVNPEYLFEEAGYYTVTLTIQNEGGCEDQISKVLCVEDIRPIFVADAFSPNGDGNNDVLHVKAKGVKEITFIIYNRFGQVVFESTSLDKGWNGTFKGKDAEAGVYVYAIQAKLIDNQVVTRKGNVTLIR